MRHLKLYRAIRLIRREGSIRRAAEKLAISPSALNRAILGFEDEMKIAVFDRVPGGVQLTAAGELLVDLVERHLREFENLRDTLDEMQQGLRGTLRLAIGDDLAGGRIMEAMARFESDFPRISTEIVPRHDIAPLRQRDVDLAILSNPATDDAVEVVHAAAVPVGVWLHAARSDAAIAGLWDLMAERVLLPPPATGTRAAISHQLRRQRLALPVSSSVPAGLLSQRMSADVPVCIFPDCAVPVDPAAWRCRRLPVVAGTVQVAILRHARVPLSRPAMACLKTLQAVLEA
jgi:DNA-binding transcriptional LysR family regulator